MARCSICYTLIKPDDPTSACGECQQSYHGGCWSELGGCATYGCKAAAVAEKPPAPARVGGGWGDTKTCPSCGSEIASSLLLCPCRATFPWADPMTPEEYGTWRGEQAAVGRAKTVLVVLFLLSIVGITAPVAGPAAGLYAYSQRKKLAGAHGTFLAVGVGGAALGAVYMVWIALLAVGM